MTPHSPRRLLAALLAAVALLAGCSHSQPRNVVIVLVDTLRPDRLGVYGSPRGLTPMIDAFGATGTVYRNAYAQSSWTNPSVASLFTSRFQSQHGVTSFGSALDDREETLAELFKARGYDTAGFISNFLLQQKLGFAQGFDVWKVLTRHDPNGAPGKFAVLKGRGDGVNAAVFEWLDGRADRSRPAFLYVHYMEPHSPYDPPDDVLAKRLAGQPVPDIAAVNGFIEMPMKPMPDALLPGAEALYDAEVASVDTAIGALFDGLRSRGVLDDAVVVVLADHGEEFKEHGLVGHHQSLYQEVIRVPIIIATTAHPQGRSEDQLVSIIDIAPTLMELTNGKIPPQYEGQSLAAGIGAPSWWAKMFSSPKPLLTRPAYSELIKAEGTLRLRPHEHAAVTDGTKLITGVGGEHDYYDLRADPGEKHPDAVAPPQRTALDHAMDQLRAYALRGHEGERPAIDADTRERMRALGYAE